MSRALWTPPTDARIRAAVESWEPEWFERWVERAGILMDSGVGRDQADQYAYVVIGRERAAALRARAA